MRAALLTLALAATPAAAAPCGGDFAVFLDAMAAESYRITRRRFGKSPEIAADGFPEPRRSLAQDQSRDDTQALEPDGFDFLHRRY